MRTHKIQRARIPRTYSEIAAWVLAGLALGGLVVAAFGCAHVRPVVPDGLAECGIDRLACVEHDDRGTCVILRSAQPTAAQFTCLVAHYGLRASLKLNPSVEAREQLPGGVELVHHPMSSVLLPDEAEVQAICNDLIAAPKPLVVHCTEGRERTGYIVERCVRMKQAQPPTPQAMYGEWLAYGLRPWLAPGLVESFERATGYEVPR